jgi:FixJ family two-component response regulator
MPSRILVIDDENNVRTMIRLALEFSGYQVEAAADGPEGLEKFGNGEGTDLVVLDQRMPGMSGEEVHAELRKRNPQTRVLIITAFGTIDLALEAMKNGAAGFLRKPFTAETLRQAVKTALEHEVATSSAVPMSRVMGAFTRTTINGFTFDVLEVKLDDRTHDRITKFEVALPTGEVSIVAVKIPPFVIELVKAYSDCERVPGDERFWSAVAEESLANYLWQHAELPINNILVLDDLSASLQRWLDKVLTVDFEECL